MDWLTGWSVTLGAEQEEMMVVVAEARTSSLSAAEIVAVFVMLPGTLKVGDTFTVKLTDPEPPGAIVPRSHVNVPPASLGHVVVAGSHVRLETLTSPGKGSLIWTPVALLKPAGLPGGTVAVLE